MRHRKGNKKLSRATDQRLALLRGIVRSLLIHGRVETTEVRGKEAKKMADKLITLAKNGSLHARRQALQVIPDSNVIASTFKTLSDQTKSRPGGYTRLIKVGHRRGDAAAVSILELVD